MPGSYPELDGALRLFSEHVDGVRQDLYYCDVTTGVATRTLRENVHGAAYVYLAAALEAYVEDSLIAVVNEINALTISFAGLRLSLLAVASVPHYESLQQIRGQKMWSGRVGLLEGTGHAVQCALSVKHLPLDGKTIRPAHFDTIWLVFGFPHSAMPSPRHKLALTDLADTRNDVAHGDATGRMVSRRRSVADTLSLLDRIEELAIHFWTATVDYLDQGLYRR